MIQRRLTVALACVALALVPGCGGDDESTDTTPDAPVPTAPETDSTEVTPAPDTTPTEDPAPVGPAPQPAPPTAEPKPDPGGAVAPPGPEPAPDSPTNDIPPPPGSGAEKFEKLCNENPDACG